MFIILFIFHRYAKSIFTRRSLKHEAQLSFTLSDDKFTREFRDISVTHACVELNILYRVIKKNCMRNLYALFLLKLQVEL